MKKTGLMTALAAAKPADGSVEAPKAGRRGKKSDPRFTQISVLVEKDAYFEVKRRLVRFIFECQRAERGKDE